MISLFARLPGEGVRIAAVVVLVVWLVRVAYTYLNNPFEPDLFLWLARVSRSLIPAGVLWLFIQGRSGRSR